MEQEIRVGDIVYHIWDTAKGIYIFKVLITIHENDRYYIRWHKTILAPDYDDDILSFVENKKLYTDKYELIDGLFTGSYK